VTFLVTDPDKPYSEAGFGNWFRDQFRRPAGCSAHGRRKAAARRLAEAGATAQEISAIAGHASLREVARYTEAADRRKLAASAMANVKSGTLSG
jgi:integrase